MAIFDEKIEIREWCKGVHCVDLGESFPTSIYLQKSAYFPIIEPLLFLAAYGADARMPMEGAREETSGGRDRTTKPG